MDKQRPILQEHPPPRTPGGWPGCILAGFLVWATEQFERADNIPGAPCLLDGVPALTERRGGASVVLVFLAGLTAFSAYAFQAGMGAWLALLGGVIAGVVAAAVAGCLELRWGSGV